MVFMDIVGKIKDTYREEYRKHPVFTVFVTIVFIFFLEFVLGAIITGGESITGMFWHEADRTLSDYFESIADSHNLPYTSGVIYPPLVTLMYMVIGHFTMPFADTSGGDPLWYALRNSQMGIMSFMVITLVTFFAIRWIISKIAKDKIPYVDILFIIIVFSHPFMYALERGNNILLAILFCFIFLAGYRSENKYIRYLSYISLGCATGFKIYPALLGLLILRNRNYRHAAECMLAIVAAMFLPFLLTDGNPLMLLENISAHIGTVSGDVHGFINLDQLVHVIFQSSLASDTVDLISYAVIISMTFLSMIVVLFDRQMKYWKVVALVMFNIILGPGVGTFYLLGYVAIPAVYMLISEKDLTKENLFFVACFAGVLSLMAVPQGIISSARATLVILMTLYILVEGLRRLYREWKDKKMCSVEERAD